MIQIPNFMDKAELFDWLFENKAALVAQKKSAIKEADAISYQAPLVNDKGEACKSESEIPATATKIKVRSIINTTKIMDSHSDVHIDQLWNKSLKENKENYLCNQHNFSFEGIISDNVKAFVKQMAWKELGFDFEGNTQALVFDSVIDKADNPMMFDKYRQGKVKNHSVGMRYVSLKMAINDDRYESEKATWDKYIDIVANKEDAEAQGYFWAVTEAKIIEGSPVVKGSNYATPTQRVEETKGAVIDTPENIEPAAATQKESIFSKLKLQK
jgi:hypothetical protein